MGLLLTHGYFLQEDEREKRILKPYPPLGLLYISAFLENAKVDHDVFDSTFSSFEDLCRQLKSKPYKQIGLYVNLMTKINILKIIRYIRSQDDLKGITIILGGPDVKYNAEAYIEQGADMIVLGEGEQTMLDLIHTLNTPFNPFLDKVNGIAFKNYFGKVVYTEDREKIKDIDTLPFPNRKRIDLNKYLDTWKKKHGSGSISISTQRGCPYTCNWCSTAVYGQSYRRRTPGNVCDEIQQLIKTYHADTFWFVDDVFTVSHKWLKEFADEIIKRQISIRYECITRADRMNESVINDLKRSGCFRVWIGAESGSQNVIDDMDRRVDVMMVKEMLIKTREAGIETGTFIMLGYPGETEEDIMKTVDHLVTSNPTHYTITIAYPIKGTTLYNQVKPTITQLDWTQSTDRDTDFQRTYPREYYTYAVRFVTNEVEYRKMPRWKRLLSPKAWLHRMKSITSQEKMQRFKTTASKPKIM